MQVSALLQVASPAAASSPSAASPTAGQSLSLAEVRAHCREQGLAAYKAPRLCLFRTAALPLNSSRKVARLQVQEVLRRHTSPESKL